jgi:hypothetical protein
MKDMKHIGQILGLWKAVRLILAYCGWLLISHVLILTLITYFLASSSPNAKLQDISEVLATNEVLFVGFSSLFFVLFQKWISPTGPTTGEIVNPFQLEKRFNPGFFRGAILAVGFTLSFFIAGYYQYVGFLIGFEEGPLQLLSVLLRVGALASLAYCEEYIFRNKLLSYLRPQLSEFYSSLAVSLIYCGIKQMQFDLGIMQLSTLFLISMMLSLRSISTNDFAHGAGFMAGLLIVFHPILGLPILGSDFNGVLMIRYLGPSGTAQSVISSFSEGADSRTALFLTGGIGGPLSSFLLQFLIGLQIAQSALREFRARTQA